MTPTTEENEDRENNNSEEEEEEDEEDGEVEEGNETDAGDGVATEGRRVIRVPPATYDNEIPDQMCFGRGMEPPHIHFSSSMARTTMVAGYCSG